MGKTEERSSDCMVGRGGTREGRLWWAREHVSIVRSSLELVPTQFLHTLPNGTITFAPRQDRMSEMEDGLFLLV